MWELRVLGEGKLDPYVSALGWPVTARTLPVLWPQLFEKYENPLVAHDCRKGTILSMEENPGLRTNSETSILPEKGVSALQNNFFITNLMDVLQRTPDNSCEDSSILETVTAVAAGKPLSCPNHDGNIVFLLSVNTSITVFLQVMEFYCQSCETAMCHECTEGEHAEHPTVPLKDVVEQHKSSLQTQLEAVKQ
eukprot:g48202.t1